MGMEHCTTGNSKGEDSKFVVPDFQKEIKAERENLISSQHNILHSMFIRAQKKKALKQEQYFSLKSIAVIMGRDISSLRKWIKRHNIKTTKRKTTDSNYQACITLTKEQVQEIMDKI